MPSIIDKLRRRFNRISRISPTVFAEQALDMSLEAVCNRLESQGLFIIGAARSGTTILQNALNDSRDIFLFGEPCFHADSGDADFASRYNTMHRSWGNQENKSSYCPPLFKSDAG